jgi:hypothetical protein
MKTFIMSHFKKFINKFKMTLTDQHTSYEKKCRQMFIGRIIHGVIYGECKYFVNEEGQNINPKPYYQTCYLDVDTLDHSIYFKTDLNTIYVFWDNTFFCYGLQSQELNFTEKTNSFEQKWDVSNEEKWHQFIGQEIVDFKIIWGEVSTSKCPKTFKITTKNRKTIILSTSEFSDKNVTLLYMDNLLVTTNVALARKLKLIE